MIIFIEGRLIESAPLRAVIDVQGIGYELHIPLTTASQLPAVGASVRLHTYAAYREDSQTLYGFHDKSLRDFFQLLVEKVSGIGPKIALGILSRLSLSTLQQALVQGDVALLSKCQGIGKKTAERLVLELKDKVGGFNKHNPANGLPLYTSPSAPSADQDAILALISLGFKQNEAEKAVQLASEKLGPNIQTAELIKYALT